VVPVDSTAAAMSAAVLVNMAIELADLGDAIDGQADAAS
jgi:hypothetical protein